MIKTPATLYFPSTADTLTDSHSLSSAARMDAVFSISEVEELKATS